MGNIISLPWYKYLPLAGELLDCSNRVSLFDECFGLFGAELLLCKFWTLGDAGGVLERDTLEGLEDRGGVPGGLLEYEEMPFSEAWEIKGLGVWDRGGVHDKGGVEERERGGVCNSAQLISRA